MFYEGQFLREAMLREHVNEDEIRTAMRLQGAREIEGPSPTARAREHWRPAMMHI